MTRTLIVEPNPRGHRFQAVRHVAALAASRGHEVSLLTSVGARDRAEFAVQLRDVPIEVVEVFAGWEPDGRTLAATVGRYCRERSVHTVVIMDGDVALKTWWWAAALSFRGLPRRPRVRYFLTRYPARLETADPRLRVMRLAKALLIVLAMCTRTIHRASGFASRDERPGGLLVARALDPALCSAHARDRKQIRDALGLPGDQLLVGIFGGINVRKNPQLVLEAVERVDEETGLVLAGPVDSDIGGWLETLPAQRRRRVFVADGFLPDELLDKYLAAVDVVALLMTLEGPSGIQGKALSAGVPVVSAGSRTRERELTAFGSGVSTDVTASAFAAGLCRVLAHPDAFTPEASTLPSAEDFAATILGRDAGRSRRRP